MFGSLRSRLETGTRAHFIDSARMDHRIDMRKAGTPARYPVMPVMIPLSRWADAQLDAVRALSDPAAFGALSGAVLMGERAAFNGFRIPGPVSAGGGCRFYQAADGHVALNLARDDDRALLPALFCDGDLDTEDFSEIAARMLPLSATEIVARGRELGLAIASLAETPISPACSVSAVGTPVADRTQCPLVIDLSGLWAGPLTGHLLELSGARVVKIESSYRPDAMRDGDPALFSRLNQRKANVAMDLRDADQRAALIALIRRADIVIEAARPRALRQLGIDADQLVREVAGLIWLTITGHGGEGDAALWTGFGDDCSVAGGLSAALHAATGAIGFGGDACGDPLTGIYAARCALERHRQGMGARLIFSMSAIVQEALAAERARDAGAGTDTLNDQLRIWAAARDQPFPAIAQRPANPVAMLGEDNGLWLSEYAPC